MDAVLVCVLNILDIFRVNYFYKCSQANVADESIHLERFSNIWRSISHRKWESCHLKMLDGPRIATPFRSKLLLFLADTVASIVLFTDLYLLNHLFFISFVYAIDVLYFHIPCRWLPSHQSGILRTVRLRITPLSLYDNCIIMVLVHEPEKKCDSRRLEWIMWNLNYFRLHCSRSSQGV